MPIIVIKPMNRNENISEFLPTGRENAISKAEWMRRTGYTCERSLRKRLQELREAGEIICSESGIGYWLPESREEMEAFVRRMYSQAKKMFISARSAAVVIGMPEGQMMVEDLLKESEDNANGEQENVLEGCDGD